jgi:hypothetical protein
LAKITSKTTAYQFTRPGQLTLDFLSIWSRPRQYWLQKGTTWKSKLADSVMAAHRQLVAYYFKTYGPGGDLYNWAAVLDIMQKLESY